MKQTQKYFFAIQLSGAAYGAVPRAMIGLYHTLKTTEHPNNLNNIQSVFQSELMLFK
ncbi:MAG: hypothetical protein R3A43_03295 [Bacteroidia bacterium]